MKTAYIILAVVLVFVNAVEDQDVQQQWAKFQANFGKSYRSPVEARKRFAIFQDNLHRIESHNKLFESGQSSYEMGINQFADMSRSEFASYRNKRMFNETKTVRNGKTFVKTPNFVAPENVDWREKGIVTPVQGQNWCKGGWPFSVTGAIEGQLGITKKSLVALSAQELVDCSESDDNRECFYGSITDGYDYVKEYGVASEEDYPYVVGLPGVCMSDKFESVTKLSSYVNIPKRDEGSLTEAIATKGPIAVHLSTTWNFHFYKRGIFDDDDCDSEYLDEAMLAVGYGTGRKDYYLIKSSLGTSWGSEGYLRLARNSGNKCCVACRASYPEL